MMHLNFQFPKALLFKNLKLNPIQSDSHSTERWLAPNRGY